MLTVYPKIRENVPSVPAPPALNSRSCPGPILTSLVTAFLISAIYLVSSSLPVAVAVFRLTPHDR